MKAGAEVGAMVTLCHFVITDNKQKLGSAGQELMTPSLSLQSGVHSSRPALYWQPLYPAPQHRTASLYSPPKLLLNAFSGLKTSH